MEGSFSISIGNSLLKRLLPNNGFGAGTSPNIGSINKFLPLICNKNVEWPNQINLVFEL